MTAVPARSSAPKAVSLSPGTMYRPFRTGRAPSQSGTVSTWAINSRRCRRKGDRYNLPERPDQPSVGARCCAQIVPVPFRLAANATPGCRSGRHFSRGGGIVKPHGIGRRHRLAEPSGDEVHHFALPAADARNGQQLHQQRFGVLQECIVHWRLRWWVNQLAGRRTDQRQTPPS